LLFESWRPRRQGLALLGGARAQHDCDHNNNISRRAHDTAPSKRPRHALSRKEGACASDMTQTAEPAGRRSEGHLNIPQGTAWARSSDPDHLQKWRPGQIRCEVRWEIAARGSSRNLSWSRTSGCRDSQIRPNPFSTKRRIASLRLLILFRLAQTSISASSLTANFTVSGTTAVMRGGK
jgi:hypothetical protein